MNENKVLVVGPNHVDTPGHSEEVSRIARLCAGANVMVLRNREQETMDSLAALASAFSDDMTAPDFIKGVSETNHYGLTPGMGFRRKIPKPMTRCGLPGCEVMSVKDYCCAEHCRQHRKMRKQ